MKALFLNVPTSGHVNPTLALVSEMVSRGHEVVYLLTESYRARFEAAGARFLAYHHIGDDFFAGEGLDGSNPPYAAVHLMRGTLALMPELLELVNHEKPDLLVYDSMCPWGWALAQATGLPSVSSTSLLIIEPQMMLKATGPFRLARIMLPGVPNMLRYGRLARQLATRYQIPALGFAEVFNAPADLVISYASRDFQPGAERLPANIRYVGPSIAPRGDDEFPFDALNDHSLVYISLGTVINRNPGFYRDCIAAFADAKLQVIMSIGQRVDLTSLGTIPGNFLVRSHVPQLEVLQRASLFITHGGMNSVLESLYYGVPMLLVPQQNEQSIVAWCVEQHDAGLRLNRGQVTVDSLRTNALRVLGDPKFRQNAHRLAQSMWAAGGAARAVDEIEALLPGR